MTNEETIRAYEAQREDARKSIPRKVPTEAEKQTKLLEEIRAILARLLAIAEYKAPRS